MASRKTPQEKKALSLARDRRNAYGANDKASRKSIPLRKRLVNRANRHLEQSLLGPAVGADADGVEQAESELRGRRPKMWRKSPDRRLSEHLAMRAKRQDRDGPSADADG